MQGLSFLGDNQVMQTILPFALIFIVFYFLLIRPQQTRAKEHKTMLSGLRRGDRVVTGGGFIGTVAKVVNDEEVLVDLAENTRVRVVRSTITNVLARTEPVAGAKEAGTKDKAETGESEGEAGGEGAQRDRRKNMAKSAAGK
jgi:preprotein translocase subunit YajC